MFSTVKDTTNHAKETMTSEGGLSDAASAYRTKKEQVADAVNESKRDLQDAKGNLKEATHNVADIAHRAGEQIRDIADQVRDYASRASHDVQGYADTMSTKIRRSPLQYVGVAAVAGLLIGRLLGRSRR